MAMQLAHFFARVCEPRGFNLYDKAPKQDIPKPWNELQIHTSFKYAMGNFKEEDICNRACRYVDDPMRASGVFENTGDQLPLANMWQACRGMPLLCFAGLAWRTGGMEHGHDVEELTEEVVNSRMHPLQNLAVRSEDVVITKEEPLPEQPAAEEQPPPVDAEMEGGDSWWALHWSASRYGQFETRCRARGRSRSRRTKRVRVVATSWMEHDTDPSPYRWQDTW
ncbi:unnamed protein product [Symbiodinium natans]|uniref:Uncharacterized protein n=1 Tax=Symbiodinium natans TaxID=878477 RepID=A0A812LQX1_9DINO|nr:unnamed protein product [Symbiodinium natans]